MMNTNYTNYCGEGQNSNKVSSRNGNSGREGINRIYLRVLRKEITTLNRIIESYDNVGVVSTVNAQEGLVMIHLTPDTEKIVRGILNELSFVQEIIEEGD